MGKSILCLIFFISIQSLQVSCLRKSSLSFAIDDTISMENHLGLVKNIIIKLMDQLVGAEKSLIEDIVVVTFNDPETKFRIKTNNRTEVLRALTPIYAHSTRSYSPCPEYSMTGTVLAMNNSLPGSTVFLFTDSDAQDKDVESAVIEQCQRTKTTVNIIIVDNNCNLEPGNIDVSVLDIYFRVAKACSGKVLYMMHEELALIENWTEIFPEGEIVPVAMFELNHNYQLEQIKFNITEPYESVIVSVSNWSYNTNIYCDNELVDVKKLSFRSTAILIMEKPKLGQYTLQIGMRSRSFVSILGKIEFSFKYGFSKQRPTSIKETKPQPIAGGNNYLSVLINDPANAISIKEIEVLNSNDETITKIPLTNVGDNFYTSEPLTLISSSFKFAVNGIAKASGRDFSQIVKTL